MASSWKNKLRGYKQIQDGTIEADQIAAKRTSADPRGVYVGVPEDKLSLDYPTAQLFEVALQIDQDRRVEDGIVVSFPFIYLRDSVNGKTYKLYTNNGTLVTEEVSV